jgi:hypothetical protein
VPLSSNILLGTAALLMIIGADVAIFVAPTIGVYVFIVAAPLAGACALIKLARYGTRH